MLVGFDSYGACGGELIWLWEKEEEEEEEAACQGGWFDTWKEEEEVAVKGRRSEGGTKDWSERDKDKDKNKEISTKKR